MEKFKSKFFWPTYIFSIGFFLTHTFHYGRYVVDNRADFKGCLRRKDLFECFVGNSELSLPFFIMVFSVICLGLMLSLFSNQKENNFSSLSFWLVLLASFNVMFFVMGIATDYLAVNPNTTKVHLDSAIVNFIVGLSITLFLSIKYLVPSYQLESDVILKSKKRVSLYALLIFPLFISVLFGTLIYIENY